ncbi:hypothetical protein JL722_6850 [Aureococcus anophagefferens]|nr:hypothetical protein JL722_6850 [Aureococcus anophagefferens]
MNAARGKLLSAPRFIAEAVRADHRGSLSGKRTLRAALSHAFAALHAAAARTTGAVERARGAHGRARRAAPRGDARRRGSRAASASARPGKAPAAAKGADEYAPGGLAAGVAPHHRDETARVKARARLYSADGALPQQSALVFELLRLSHVALSAAPATAEAAVNAGWTRCASSVLDVFGEPREEHRRSLRDARRKTLGRRLKTKAHAALMPFCGETGDDDGDDDRESVGWVLATVSALRDELRAARDAFFFSERSGVGVGAARRGPAAQERLRRRPAQAARRPGRRGRGPRVLRAVERAADAAAPRAPSRSRASAALRDAMRRVRSPLGRFLKPQAVANMRHMLDEATICGQMAKRLRADELGERAPRGLWFAMTASPSPTATRTTRCSPRRRSPTATATRPRATGRAAEPPPRRAARGEAAVQRASAAPAGAARRSAEASAAPSGADRDAWLRNGEAVRRLAELGWLRCSWLGGDRGGGGGASSCVQIKYSTRLQCLEIAARHVARIGARSATAGFDAAAEAGSRACARRDAALAKQGAAAARGQRVRPRCRDGDYRRDCHLAAAARDVRAADVAWRALRASTRDAGWAPFAADAVAPDDRRRRAAQRRRGAAAPPRGDGPPRRAGRQALLAPAPRVASHEGAAYRRREAQGDARGQGRRRRRPGPGAPRGEAAAAALRRLRRRARARVADVFRPSRDQCVAAYAVRVVTPRGPVRGELRVAPRSLYFVAGESAAELKKGENAPERWRLDGLTAVRGRRYLLRPLALEFFFATRREVFVAFESPRTAASAGAS